MQQNVSLHQSDGEQYYCQFYLKYLKEIVIPFWCKNGFDQQHGGMFTCLNRDGTLMDSDKSVWFQGRAGWMFSQLYKTIEQNSEWKKIAKSCVDFSLNYCHRQPDFKMYFTMTNDGQPLRMRRYVYSDSFAAISYAVYSQIEDDHNLVQNALKAFEVYLKYSFEPNVMEPKFMNTRPSKGICPHIITIVTAQEIRQALGDVVVSGKSMTEWIDNCISEIEKDFVKPELQAVMETVGLDGSLINHSDGRTLNPGHAIECSWFIMIEGRLRNKKQYIELGLKMLDWMWERGWDPQYGGILNFVDIYKLPVQEYSQDMKFWWPHCETIIATLVAWKLTGEQKYAEWHQQVHDWSFKHFHDEQYGEWYGYLHRDGSVAQQAKGNIFKGPFHLPRMLWFCHQELKQQK